ncbi:MAG: M48 family metalloprotease [Gaiellaceae bacterium MAG52_C11]|nr:M48 family metalloprotease [Candidatus Gaiellasilicea maunaloa]
MSRREGGGSRGNHGLPHVFGATLAGAWLVAAALLWRTSVPSLEVPDLEPSSLFDAETLSRNARYENGLAALWVLGLGLQLVALWLLARRAPSLPGPLLFRAALMGALVFATLWLAELPVRLGVHWWRRRYDVSELGYLGYLAGPWSTTLGELALAAIAGLAIVAAGRLLGRRAWLGLWAAFVALAVAYVLVYPSLLAPRLRPLQDRQLATQIQQLGARIGLEEVEVEVRKARERTRAVNAEAIGAGPTTRVILWDTLLAPEVGRGEVRFAAAHELGHVARRHPWKGVVWFALLALPGAWLLGRVARLREPPALPRVALVLLLLQLATLPLANAISRRYEAEADAVGLRLTRDGRAAEALYRRFARTSLSDPDPPLLLHLLRDTHPTLAERIATARAGVPPGDPGSP